MPSHSTPFNVTFWSKVDRTGEYWLWTSWRERGYGRVHDPRVGKRRRAHRIAWELVNGPIPDSLLICHHCDNPSCVRPSHLFLGTQADNQADCVRKGRMAQGDRNGSRLHHERLRRGDTHPAHLHPERCARGERQWNARLTASAVRDIRVASAVGYTYAVLGEIYGVTPQAIYLIVKRKNWAHVP